MSLSLYEASVSVFAKLLTTLDATVDKAVAHAAASKYPAEVLFAARLYPDMWNCGEQVRATTNHAIRGTARLAGIAIPSVPEAVVTTADVKARIAATLDFVKSVDPAAVEAGADREIVFPMGREERRMAGREYFFSFSLPNFYFHLTTTYAILRHNGVPLHKTDFTGPV